jgi:hypothetical protein
MSADNVFDIRAAIKKFIDLDVVVIIRLSDLFAVIFLWKETRSSQDEAREPMISIE